MAEKAARMLYAAECIGYEVGQALDPLLHKHELELSGRRKARVELTREVKRQDTLKKLGTLSQINVPPPSVDGATSGGAFQPHLPNQR